MARACRIRRRLALGLVGGLMYLFATGSVIAAPIQAVASFTIVADVVKQIGGDAVHVVTLVPANGDPHTYSPSPGDSRTLAAADISFISGDTLETWFKRLARAANAPPPIVVSNGISARHTDEQIDPHVWNDAANVEIWVDNMATALSRIDPADADKFHRRAAAYRAQLEALDTWIHAQLDRYPRDKREVLTDHDAFSYYGAAYGVTFLAPLGISTDSEPSARALAGLIDRIRGDHVQTYFLENATNARLARQLAQATGARPGGTLYPESLSGPDGPAASYIALMKHNTRLIAAAAKHATDAAAADSH